MADPSLLPHKSGFYLWRYVPSLPAAILFALLFGIATAAHCYRLWKSRLWRLCIWLVIGGLMEVVGYVSRVFSRFRTDQLIPYIVQSTFILLPPILFAATVYMMLGRIICSVRGEQYSLVRVTWMTKTFVFCDIVSFCVQGGGAGIMVQGGESMKLGEKLVVGGLMIQVVAFGFFCVTTGVWHWRYQTRSVGAVAYDGGFGYDNRSRRANKAHWKTGLCVLYANSALIMVRSLFRVVEFSMGQEGYLLSHEWMLYVFDSVLMLAVMVLLYVWHPSLLQQHDPERIHSTATQEELNIIDIKPYKNTQREFQ